MEVSINAGTPIFLHFTAFYWDFPLQTIHFGVPPGILGYLHVSPIYGNPQLIPMDFQQIMPLDLPSSARGAGLVANQHRAVARQVKAHVTVGHANLRCPKVMVLPQWLKGL